MRIVFPVNQAAALRRGIDAPHSTVTLELDPAQFDAQDRELLASLLSEGHRSRLSLAKPDLDGVREQLDALRAEAAEHEARRLTALQAACARERALLGTTYDLVIEASLDTDGSIRRNSWGRGCVRRAVTLPYRPRVTDIAEADIPDDLRAALAAHDAALDAAYEALRPAMTDEAAKQSAERAKAEQAEAERRAAYDALYARLPATLRERAIAGDAGDGEVKRALVRLLREDAGYRPRWREAGERIELATELTDAEFGELRAAERSAPDGAEVTPLDVSSSRIAESCDYHYPDGDLDCDDCTRETTHRRRLARIRWSVAGVSVTAYLLLSAVDQPDDGTTYAELATEFEARTQR